MATKTHTQKDGTIWEWEETPELINLLKEIHKKSSNSEDN